MPNPFVLKLEHGAALTDTDRTALVHLARNVRAVGRRQTLVEEGDPQPRAYIILEGWACRSKFHSNGQQQITDLILPGDACHAFTSLLDYADHSVTMISDGTVAEIDLADVTHLVEHRPNAGRALHWSSLQADSILRQALSSNGQLRAEERIAHLICEIQARLRMVGRVHGDRFAWPITQMDLGAAVALSNVHVNRSLMALRAQALISLRDRVMIVPDLERLAAHCDFRPDYLHLAGCRRLARSTLHPAPARLGM